MNLNVARAFEANFLDLSHVTYGHMVEEVGVFACLLQFKLDISHQISCGQLPCRLLCLKVCMDFCSVLTSVPVCMDAPGSCLQAIHISLEGEVVACYLCHLQREVDESRLRSEALCAYSPIHR